MAKKFTRRQILERLEKNIDEGKPIIGAGCSAGIIAKCAEIGGADLIIVYSTGKSRLMGLPTTRLGDSNAVTLDMFEEIQNVVKDTPIIAGVGATDPTRMDLKRLLKRFSDTGYSGVINFPTVMVFTGWYRDSREQVGLGASREFEMISLAHDIDLFTMAYVFDSEAARATAEAKVDCIVAHVGGTAGGLVGLKAKSYPEAAAVVQEIITAAKSINPHVICLAHGGPFATPKDTVYLYEHTDAVGFVGASSIERIPVERAVLQCVKEFKSVPIKQKGKC